MSNDISIIAYLKSNMDRFIAVTVRNKVDKSKLFKIQYG